MSYCQVIVFRDGKPAEAVEYDNAWGGAAFIWTAIFDKWCKNPAIPYDNWMSSQTDRRLWDAWKREDVPECCKALLVSTFDFAVIYRKDFARFAADCRAFVAMFPKGDSYCHLLAWANQIESCDGEAVGFHGTSVCSNPWVEWNDDEPIPYDLRERDAHFDVYELVATASAVAVGLPREMQKRLQALPVDNTVGRIDDHWDAEDDDHPDDDR